VNLLVVLRIRPDEIRVTSKRNPYQGEAKGMGEKDAQLGDG